MSEKLPVLPTKADDELMGTYVKRVVTVVQGATEDQVERGESWYPMARSLAEYIGDGNVELGAGLLAVFSANKSWGQNKILAADAANGNVHGHVGVVLEKARRILEGTDPMIVLDGQPKTSAFYRTILDPPPIRTLLSSTGMCMTQLPVYHTATPIVTFTTKPVTRRWRMPYGWRPGNWGRYRQ